ncbi:MAG: division/cell wall cluster transcriptional repressor MraZ [Proteobacteria bacterium]|nr:division/cell wall cluster transcriptional repressor MraZ [Pseudomonadota bacterium]
MFQGVVGINLDVKGRLAIPTKHREQLTSGQRDKLILTSHPHRCLLLYPVEAWNPIRAQIMTFSSFDPKLSLWKRLLVGFAEEMELDNAGRVLISASQRQFAGLEKRVMLVGQGSHFELWSESSWDKQISQFDDGPTSPPPGMENFAL